MIRSTEVTTFDRKSQISQHARKIGLWNSNATMTEVQNRLIESGKAHDRSSKLLRNSSADRIRKPLEF